MASNKVGNALNVLRRGVKTTNTEDNDMGKIKVTENDLNEAKIVADVEDNIASEKQDGGAQDECRSKSKQLLNKIKGKAPMNKNNSDIVSESNTDGQVPTSTNLMIQAQLDMLTKNMTAVTPVVNLMSQFIQDNMTGEHIGQYDSEEEDAEASELQKEEGEIVENTTKTVIDGDSQVPQPQAGPSFKLLDKLSKNMKSREKLADPINPKLAEIVNDLLSNGVSDDMVKEQKEKYCRPENCDFLTVPKVNEEIWQHAIDTLRAKDLKLQNIQKSVLTSLTVVVQLMDKTMSAIEKNTAVSRTELLDGCSEAVSLLASANQDINVRRKELWRPELEETYKGLCTYSKPVTTLLFGDNLPQKVKELADTQRMHSRIDKRKMTNRRGPFARFQPFQHKPFLGRGYRKQANWWQPQPVKQFPYKKSAQYKNQPNNKVNKYSHKH